MRRRVLEAAVALLVLIGLGTALWAGQRRLMYFPEQRLPPLPLSGWEEVSFDTADGLTLQAWYRAPKPGRPLVVVFNGNAGNRGDRLPLGSSLATAGLGVLLTDYRGYGGNPGHPTEDGLALDAQAAADFATSKAPEHPLAFFGESLGTAVAVRLAVTHSPAVLILRSPFTSMVDVGRHHYPWLPVKALLKDRYTTDERIRSIDVPTLVVAGDADSIVPVNQSRRVYELAPGPKHLVVIPGADHNDTALAAGETVVAEVVAFVANAADP